MINVLVFFIFKGFYGTGMTVMKQNYIFRSMVKRISPAFYPKVFNGRVFKGILSQRTPPLKAHNPSVALPNLHNPSLALRGKHTTPPLALP
jgi:hypothetical protein